MKGIYLNKAIYTYLYLEITTGKYKTSMTCSGWPEREGGEGEGEGGGGVGSEWGPRGPEDMCEGVVLEGSEEAQQWQRGQTAHAR